VKVPSLLARVLERKRVNWSLVNITAEWSAPVLGVGVTPTHDNFVAIRRRDIARFSIDMPTL